MTEIVFNNCEHCRKQFRTFYTKGKKQIYCTNSCKQKAYKARVKQKKESEKRMLTAEAYVTQQRIVEMFGEKMDYTLGWFFNSHGKEAYQDMMTVFDLVFALVPDQEIPF